MLKYLLFGGLCLLALAIGGVTWLAGLVERDTPPGLAQTSPADLSYLQRAVQQPRGRILAVVTSTATMGASGKRTGYELTELARAYYVFTANGYEVDIASPAGGEPPVVIDDEDMGPFDFAFLNDPEAQNKVRHSLTTAMVEPARYDAVYFVGGKGAMWDFPDDAALQRLLRQFQRDDKVVAAVCHGPAALVNARLDNGDYLLAGRRVSGFTNEEELFLIPEARAVFPFLLEERMRERGAIVEVGAPYLEQVSRDGQLLTGQNPWSVWPLAEAVIEALGHRPIPRSITADENSVRLLAAYEESGYAGALTLLASMRKLETTTINHSLIAMHGVIAAMRWQTVRTVNLLALAAAARRAGAEG